MMRLAARSDLGSRTLEIERPDQGLGWSPIPGAKLRQNNINVTLDALGTRRATPYEPNPARFLVLAVGDSFTFGAEADDADTWPARLEALDPRLHVLNIGVSGYGMDQMALRQEQFTARFKPGLVVAAFIDDDLNRSLLGFRDYKKPRFVREGEKLRLRNSPIGPHETILAEAHAAASLQPSTRLGMLAMNIWENIITNHERSPLNARIVERMEANARQADADFLLLYLPHGRELAEPEYISYGQIFFNEYLATHSVNGFNPRPFFNTARTDTPFAHGHYQGREAQIVAEALRERIVQSPAFKAFSADKSKAVR